MSNINVESFKEKQNDGFDKLRAEIYTTLKELEKMEKRAIKAEDSTDVWRTFATGLVIAILSAGVFAACDSNTTKPKKETDCGKWVLQYSNDNNFTNQSILCDSLQMINDTEAYVYVDGRRVHIFADLLFPRYLNCHE